MFRYLGIEMGSSHVIQKNVKTVQEKLRAS